MKYRLSLLFLAATILILSTPTTMATDLQHLATRTWQHGGAYTISRGVWAGDLDRDGLIEIVSAGYRFNPSTDRHEACLRIYRYIASSGSWMGEGARKWASPTGDIYCRDVAVGDADKDGELEIVTVGYFWNGSAWKYQLKAWFKARGNRAPTTENTRNDLYTELTRPSRVVIGDVDDDGQNEVVTVGYCWPSPIGHESAFLGIFGYTEASGFTPEHQYWIGHTTYKYFFMDVAVGDVDNDGETEIVCAGYNNNDQGLLYIYRWDGSTLSGEAYDSIAIDSYSVEASRVAVGDVDSDGECEIVVAGRLPGTGGFIRVYRWDGSTLTTEHTDTYTAGERSLYGLDVGDVDDDGQTEIATAYYYDAGAGYYCYVRVYRWDGSTWTQEDSYGPWIVGGVDTYLYDLVVYDADQDGEQEIVVTGNNMDGYAYIRIFNA